MGVARFITDGFLRLDGSLAIVGFLNQSGLALPIYTQKYIVLTLNLL